MVMKISVKKMSGELELYDENKLIGSMKRAGADEKTIEEILKKVRNIIYEGMETKKLFNFVLKELKKKKIDSGIRYNLKQGIIEMSLGGGYVFEKFIGKLLEKMGYKIKMNLIIKGKNITHEIDVSAFKGNEKLMVECKHYSKPWLGTSIQTALYVYARFMEVEKEYNKPMLVTNTKFSEQVIKYSKGVGIKLMGWKYPKGESLEESIERYGVYPITILPLKKQEIRRYMEKNILTFDDLLKEKNLSQDLRREIEMMVK